MELIMDAQEDVLTNRINRSEKDFLLTCYVCACVVSLTWGVFSFYMFATVSSAVIRVVRYLLRKQDQGKAEDQGPIVKH